MHTIQVRKISNLLGKSIGLLGQKKPFPLFFSTHFGIHTIGMQFPIDVVILDNKKRVRKLKKSLKPFRFFLWNPKYRGVLELPEGSIKTRNIQIGDTVQLQNL